MRFFLLLLVVLVLVINLTPIRAQTALMNFSANGELETVEALIENGADVNARDQEGHTALVEAARNGHIEIVKKLIENGADVYSVNLNGANVLRQANSYPEIVKIWDLYTICPKKIFTA